jgi:hypothetical protein
MKQEDTHGGGARLSRPLSTVGAPMEGVKRKAAPTRANENLMVAVIEERSIN